jgi:hypothetical protein
MKVLEYVRSNICIIEMIVGIVLISNLFLLPLEEHWWYLQINDKQQYSTVVIWFEIIIMDKSYCGLVKEYLSYIIKYIVGI